MSHLTRRELLKTGAALAAAPAFNFGFHTSSWAKGPYDDAVLKPGPPPMPKPGSFTVAVLPDTQLYSQSHPATYMAQTEWIVDQKKDRNIACVLHLGDITNRNTPDQWENAQKAMYQLDGQVPYFMAIGNHDCSAGGSCKDRTTHFNEYFPVDKYSDLPTFGGVYDKEPDRFENSYQFFEVDGRKFIVFALEFGPRKDVVRWANEIAKKHQDREAILITHAYMYYNDDRYDWQKYGKKQNWNPYSYGVANSSTVSDGEDLWNNLVKPNPNFMLTLNGHVIGDGLGRTRTANVDKEPVNQVLVNFQMKPNGGDGWLRLLEFRRDGNTVQTYDYSPTLDQRNESKQNQFTMKV